MLCVQSPDTQKRRIVKHEKESNLLENEMAFLYYHLSWSTRSLLGRHDSRGASGDCNTRESVTILILWKNGQFHIPCRRGPCPRAWFWIYLLPGQCRTPFSAEQCNTRIGVTRDLIVCIFIQLNY